jgi:hypothetical protein
MLLEPVIRRAALFGALATVGAGLIPAGAAASASPYSVNITQFSRQVSGVAPPGVTSVTVDLLRNAENATGKVVRNQVDSFTAQVGASGAWSGSFASHEPAGQGDQVEVDYAPIPNEVDPSTGSPGQLTIGSGYFLPNADQRNASGVITAQTVALSPDISHGVWISHDGHTITCPACSGFQVSVDKGSPQITAGDQLKFASPVTAGQSVQVTAPDAWAENTQINMSFPAPLLSLVEQPLPGAPAGTPPVEDSITGLPYCNAYLVIDEVVCHNLTPGSYTLSDGTDTRSLTVPAAVVMPAHDGDMQQTLFVPQQAGAVIPGLTGNQEVELSQGGRTLSTLTVDPLWLSSSMPLGDLLNGANATTIGSCSPGLFIADDGQNPDLCTSVGTLPSPNSLTSLATSLTQNDEGSPGSTTVMLPQFALQQPADGASLFAPFRVTAQLRYTDPLAQVAQANAPAPKVGSQKVIASTPSGDAVAFSYAPLGSSKFTNLGNVNVAGGLRLPSTLRAGAYDGRWTVADAGGDSYTRDTVFYNQGTAVGNLATARCVLHAGGGRRRATVARETRRSATFRCSAHTGAHVALWIQRGTRVIADGTGTARHGRVTIAMSGARLTKGTYELVEVIDLAGQSNQTSRILKLS